MPDEMTDLELPYGDSVMAIRVPAASVLGVLAPQAPSESADEGELVHAALANPIGTPRLRDLAISEQRVVIVTSDLTRPCPSERLLPPIMEELAAAGVPESNVTVVIALGLHRPMTEGELAAAVGPQIYRRLTVLNHDAADTIRLGVTSAGTPVEIYRPVVEADLRICLGNLELHYFAGYSGGAKAILPGCASRATLNANHAMMVRPEAVAGRLDGNPVRADIEEGVAMLGVDFILNVVADGHHRIVSAVAGDVTAAHRQGCRLVARRSSAPIPGLADVVLVSAGGYPKDLNLYQAQKALDNAAYAVRPGGILILVAECGEGFGGETFEAWMTGARSPDELLARIQAEFVLGGHKAAAIAAVQKRASIYLVSAFPAEVVRQCGMMPFPSLGTALSTAYGQLGSGASLVAMPQGGSILPFVGK